MNIHFGMWRSDKPFDDPIRETRRLYRHGLLSRDFATPRELQSFLFREFYPLPDRNGYVKPRMTHLAIEENGISPVLWGVIAPWCKENDVTLVVLKTVKKKKKKVG